jgi:hypothetical protein
LKPGGRQFAGKDIPYARLIIYNQDRYFILSIHSQAPVRNPDNSFETAENQSVGALL